MGAYILRRLSLLPVTLFAILIVNFVIINLAPGDPVTVTEISPEGGATRQADRSFATGGDLRWLQFREHYGLTLPILINLWPWTSKERVIKDLNTLAHPETMSVKAFDQLRLKTGDRARFVMPILIEIMNDPLEDKTVRQLAVRYFVRGGTRQAFLGSDLTVEQKKQNRKIAKDNLFLSSVTLDNLSEINAWYQENKQQFQTSFWQIFETRFFRYLGKVVTFDFGSLRNDPGKSVISEVSKRFKYSLTLAILPLCITFFLCQLFGMIMASQHNRFSDFSMNFFFLVLYAIPIFVAAPFLIEKVALNRTFPWTDIPIPISGFTSPESIYQNLTSQQRLFDVLKHICLPLIAIMYGSLAATSRLSRTAFLEVNRLDFVRTAHAKGVHPVNVWVKHVGRNAAITIVTSLAGSLGIVLGGSLIVETLFEINGFGKFFYDAVINRDYNVILFSSLAGSFLTLTGYLVADVTYMLLDPRVALD